MPWNRPGPGGDHASDIIFPYMIPSIVTFLHARRFKVLLHLIWLYSPSLPSCTQVDTRCCCALYGYIPAIVTQPHARRFEAPTLTHFGLPMSNVDVAPTSIPPRRQVRCWRVLHVVAEPWERCSSLECPCTYGQKVLPPCGLTPSQHPTTRPIQSSYHKG